MAISKLILNGVTQMDVTDTTATVDDVASGKVFTKVDGVKGTGTASVSVTEPEPLDVDFIDYDGTLLYSYTAADFLALSEMPPNPSHDGLVAQGWNWKLADAQAQVRKSGFHVIGQNYTTSDGKTRIYITIGDSDTLAPQAIIVYPATSPATYTIDWGDGSTSTQSNVTNNTQTKHTYTSRGDYVISITPTSGKLMFGYWGSNQGVVWTNNAEQNDAVKRVRKIEIGNNITRMGSQPFSHLVNLESVSLPATLENNGNPSWGISSVPKLKGLVIPNGVVTTGNQMQYAYNLKYLSLPNTITAIGNSNYLHNVKKLLLPDSITSLSEYAIREARNLERVYISDNVTTYPTNMFYSFDVSSLQEITISSAVTEIKNGAFNGSRLSKIHLKPTTPPTLANSNAFPSLNNYAVLYVPYSADHSILTAYQSATNWSSFASKMQEEPQ